MHQYQRIQRANRTSKYRSGLEEAVANQLNSLSIPFEYEKLVLNYTRPEKEHRYTPDFVLNNGIIIKCKGQLLTSDRQKMILVKKHHPKRDIRFVFSNSKSRISKKSKTTYAMWCERNGFPYADKFIPTEWLDEKPVA